MSETVADRGAGPATDRGVLLEADGLSVVFDRPHSLADRLRGRPRSRLHAVDGAHLTLHRGESLALVGESGSGKSTLARALMGLTPLDAGTVTMDGTVLPGHRSRSDARRMQMVFQDPYSSLNPRLTVGAVLTELLSVHGLGARSEREATARNLLTLVGLSPSAYDAYPRQFSGGQRQRVAIARALVLEPELLVADEPVSALDVSVQATILNLLGGLVESLDLTMLFVAHNLAVVRHLCDRVAVMYLGRIVEVAPTEQLFADPRHPYTRGLLQAIPRLTPGSRVPVVGVQGDPPSPYAVPTGCRFHPRCPLATERCRVQDPELTRAPSITTEANSRTDHVAACHYAFGDEPAAHRPEVLLDLVGPDPADTDPADPDPTDDRRESPEKEVSST